MQKTLARFSLASLASLPALSFAAVPTEVSTAITDMKADALTVAAAVLVAIIVVMAVKFIRKGM
jgi:hypothetical protein